MRPRDKCLGAELRLLRSYPFVIVLDSESTLGSTTRIIIYFDPENPLQGTSRDRNIYTVRIIIVRLGVRVKCDFHGDGRF
jgi:hypothetical protein